MSLDRLSLKVLFVINGLGTGGAERSLAEMLPLMAPLGIDARVVCLFPRERGVQEWVRSKGIDVRFLPATGWAGRIRGLRRILVSDWPDLVHTSIFDADVTGRLAAAGLRVPLISTLANTAYDPVRLADPNIRRVRLAAVRAIDGWTARHLTTHFHAISQAVADSAVRTMGISRDRITVVARGRDPVRLGEPSRVRKAEARRRLGLETDDEVLIAVGRQEFQKGHRYLLEAMASLADRKRLVLILTGRRGHASEEIEALRSRLGLADRVRILDHRDDVPELLAAADVFVFPSLYEGFGGAVAEAMALALPVVASDLPALREVAEPDGSAVLVPPMSSDALASALRRILDDPSLQKRLGARGREIFLERFTIDRATEGMARLFHSVADAGDRGASRVAQ